jgi:hypothetical protein
LGGIAVPYFVWFGILGLLLLYAAGIVMFLVKKKAMVKLRRHHEILGTGAAVSLTVHGVWANLDHAGHAMPLFGWVGILALAGVFFGYYAMNRAKKVRDRKWTEFHWKVGLASVVVATAHGAWFALRILGR